MRDQLGQISDLRIGGAVFERFTERSRQVVIHAQETAREAGHGYIGTEHVLVGLTFETDALSAQVLAYLGVDHDEVQASLLKVVPATGDTITGQIPFTPRAKKVLELALREALSLGSNYIGTEHILLGLVRENEGVAARILLDHDIDSEKVRNEVIRRLNGKPRQKPAPPVVGIDLMRIGDRLQSEASRIAEYLKGEKVPYEVAMAVHEVEAAVREWTEARHTMGAQRAA